jgi:p-aminobenzoyl-glutamate transporter AbgT
LEWDFLVYCSKCGTKNEEDAVFCVKCGASLTGPSAWRRGGGRREKQEKQEKQEKGEIQRHECFGLPHGGAIVGIIIGIIVILVGILQVPGLIPDEILDVTDPFFWPVIVIVFGILIFAGALYQYGRRR